jgi:hypothetical protein
MFSTNEDYWKAHQAYHEASQARVGETDWRKNRALEDKMDEASAAMNRFGTKKEPK